MADIRHLLDKIRKAIYGKEVRGSLADGLEAVNNEVEDATEVAVNVEHRQDAVEQQFNTLLGEWSDDKPIDNAETIAARTNTKESKTYENLGKRLDEEYGKVTEQLAETEEDFRNEMEERALNARWFGVKTIEESPDYDSTDNLQELIDSLPLSGGTIFIPSGTVLFNRLNFKGKKNIKITGVGSATLKTMNVLTTGGDRYPAIKIDDCENLIIESLAFESKEGDIGIWDEIIKITDSCHIKVRDTFWKTPGGYTIFVEESDYLTFESNNMSHGSIWLNKNCEHVNIDKNFFKDTWADSVKLASHVDFVAITNNKFIGSRNDAIDGYARGQNVIIANNHFENCMVSAIQLKTVLTDNPLGNDSRHLGYCKKIIISNNTFRNNPEYDILIKKTDDREVPDYPPNLELAPENMIIEGNYFEDGKRAVYCNNALKVTVANNQFKDISDRSIMFSSVFAHCVIANNIIDGGGFGIDARGTDVQPSENVIAGNIIINTDEGIYFNGKTTSITDNKIKNVKNFGIYLSAIKDTTVSGNTVSMCGRDGLWVRGGTNNILNGNIAKSNLGAGLYIRDNTNTILIGNNSHDNDANLRYWDSSQGIRVGNMGFPNDQ